MQNTYKPLQGFSVCIDPGHGGKDSGAVDGQGKDDSLITLEKNINLDISLLLYNKLTTLGARVALTRASDWYPTLPQRCQIANNFGANVFISLHCNAATNSQAEGIETVYNSKSQNGQRLAELVQQELIKATKADNRGTKIRDDLAVLRGTKMPAALVEMGFITNAKEEIKLNDKQYQRLIADAIANAIIRYKKGEKA